MTRTAGPLTVDEAFAALRAASSPADFHREAKHPYGLSTARDMGALLERMERLQAEADKTQPEEHKPAVAAAELKPGERKVISDGSAGPVVEIIRRSTADTVSAGAALDPAGDAGERATTGDE